jgi:hypothetical protein
MNVQMAVKSPAVFAWILAVVFSAGDRCGADSSPDIVFSTPFRGRPTTARFYYNQRAIGEGREAFVEVLKRVRALPEGASIVWGPNFDRCGACSGSEPPCLPKHLYPDLWKELESIAADRHFAISSSYPEPWVRSTRKSARAAFPTEIVADRPPDIRFDATLDWEVGERSKSTENPAGTEFWHGRLHRFKSNNASLAGYERELFLDRIPENSRLLVRVTLRDDLKSNDAAALAEIVDAIDEGLFWFVRQHVRLGKLKATVVVPAAIVPLLKQRPEDKRKEEHVDLRIRWKNFYGPDTPHDEILYYANSTFLGRGDTGFDRILEKIDELPRGAKVEMPRYVLQGKVAFENFSEEERKSRNARLKELVPLGERKAKLDARIKARKLKADFWEVNPGKDKGTVLSWSLGAHGADEFVDSGHIVRHDEQPQRAAARLGWVRYDAHQTGYDRELESNAVYTLDDVEVGRGVAGFEDALQRIEKLPEGSLVQVRVCLRTKGPFLCPLIYEGERHFERSGFEPYIDLLDLFMDVAQRRNLKIEWLPDEGKSCGDCQLNR